MDRPRIPIDRRGMIAASAATLGATILPALAFGAAGDKAPFAPPLGPRARVMLVNDLAGDVDGLFAAVHAVLSPSIDLRAIVTTSTGVKTETAQRATELAHEMLAAMGREGTIPVATGAAQKLQASGAPDRSAGTMALIAEARRTDSKLPLYVAVGGGLTELASALALAPDIANRMTLIWIGGGAYPEGGTEYNFAIDRIAAQQVFASGVPIWQVPSDIYAACQISLTELQARVAPHGRIGAWLYARMLAAAADFGSRYHLNTGETWTLGDSPLVLLTALTAWPPTTMRPVPRSEATGGSRFDERPAPLLNDNGSYRPRSDGPAIRVYRSVDTRLMFEDFFAKLEMNYPA